MRGKYSLPTIGGLRGNEIFQVASLFDEMRNWDGVRKAYFENNISQTSKASTAKRYFAYMKSIVTSWTEDELKAFLSSSYDEKKNFIWLAFCRQYPLVAEFASSCIRENTLNGQLSFSIRDFMPFISKLVDSEKIEEPTPAVFNKGRTIIYQMLREMGYFDGKALQGGSLPPAFIKLVFAHNPEELRYFPVSDQSIRRGLTS